jgi:hypothetical protein
MMANGGPTLIGEYKSNMQTDSDGVFVGGAGHAIVSVNPNSEGNTYSLRVRPIHPFSASLYPTIFLRWDNVLCALSVDDDTANLYRATVFEHRAEQQATHKISQEQQA